MRTRRTAPKGGSEPCPGVVSALAKGYGHSLRAPPSQDTAQNRRDPRELISVSLGMGRHGRRFNGHGACPLPSARSLILVAFIVLDQRVGRVVMNGLEVLRRRHISKNAVVRVQPPGNVTHHVLNELRIVVGTLGDVLLVGTLEQTVE